MEGDRWLAERFEEHRTHLRAVAFRLLGSTTEADDALQEAWLRVSRAGTAGVENLKGWLTTVVSRVCLNMLEARRSRREDPLDPRTPGPGGRGAGGPDPEQEALLAEAVGPALLVVLETLDPAERLAFVLHDVFGVPFDEIATIMGRSPVAARAVARQGPRRDGRGRDCRRAGAWHAPRLDRWSCGSRLGGRRRVRACAVGLTGTCDASKPDWDEDPGGTHEHSQCRVDVPAAEEQSDGAIGAVHGARHSGSVSNDGWFMAASTTPPHPSVAVVMKRRRE